MKIKRLIVSVLALSMLMGMPVVACEQSEHHHKSTKEIVEEAVENNFSIGEVKGNVYENPFFNVRIEAPEGYNFNSYGLMTIVNNYSTTDKAKEITKRLVEVALSQDYAVPLLNADNGSNSELEILVGYVADNTDDYLNESALIESKLDNIADSFKSRGFSDVKTSLGTTTFLGEEHPCMDITGTIDGTTYNQKYVCIPKDGYVLVIGFGGSEQEDFAPITNATKLN